VNYLALCRRVAQESGTINNGGTLPLTVTAQGGRLAKVVGGTQQAWVDIQNQRSDWRWMQGEFAGALLPSVARYTPASLGIPSRFRAWVENRHGYQPLSLYDPDIGFADEGSLRQISWQTWRHHYGRGAQATGKPGFFAISPGNDLCFGSVPDRAYAVRGEYYKSAQIMAADADVPEMPEQYHMAIVWKAVILLHQHDEAVPNVNMASQNFDMAMRDLVNDQLPEITVGGRVA
jgi:hypothetical protein